MRRSHVLLAGAALLAGVGAFANGGRGAAENRPAEIPGTALDPEAAVFASLATETSEAEPAAAAQATAKPAPAAPKTLGDQLDLDHVTKVGDHYEAPLLGLPAGRHAVLTLEPELQELAEKLLTESRAPRGAIVAMAPDGRILALAGRKADDPKGSAAGTPDWHLATEAWAPAASVFKLVTASALVAAGVDPDDKIPFHGGIRSVVESNLHDDKRDSASQSLTFGVAHSNNAILGKLAYLHLEPGALSGLAHAIGLDRTYAQIPGVAGKLTLPVVHDLEFAKAAAGFTGTELSAVGGAMLATTFADQGEQPTPRLIASIVSSTTTTEPTYPAPHRVITTEVAKSVARMMMQTCDVGSASKSFGRGRKLHVAGKTGTLTRTEPFYMEHSWFVGFAPADKPSIVVSVVLGNPENWHLRGQEAARRMIDRAIGREKDRTSTTAAKPRQRDKRNQW